MSTTFSKLAELCILDECNECTFSDLQFGFVKGRGTDTALALAHDVSAYCVFKGSQVYMCGLDTEGAFDALPHPVIFQKAYSVMSKMSWLFLCRWYGKINVQIKWQYLSNPIPICKGTRQGGLTSIFLFNLFYKDLVNSLSIQDGWVTIGYNKYNVICYADDLLLLSTTVTGLQKLIDVANSYIVDHGLRFNPQKTTCVVRGKQPFTVKPKWYINDCELLIEDNMKYLGGFVGNQCGKLHSESRISSCRKSYFALQGAGLTREGLSLDAAMYAWSSVCNSALLYGCNALYLNKSQVCNIDKIQSKLIKCIVGLKPMHKTTSLLQALKVPKVSVQIDVNNYSCGLSTATIEYSSLSVCLCVCLSVCLSVCVSVCLSVYTITQKIMVQST